MDRLDSQAIEIIGRSLIEQLLLGGVEVALPARDRGIDLIAYLDIGDGLSSFSACPIQMKASTARAFSINDKYSKFPNLIHAFVWNVSSQAETEVYALTQAEAVAMAGQLGYTETQSWLVGAHYASTKPSVQLVDLLRQYRMTPQAWRAKVEGAARL